MMSGKSGKRKDTGMILLGFAVLMFGMDTMSGAVAGLRDVPQFREILLMFTNPILGVVAGALLTAIIQSSSASVGILQALASTGQVTYGAAIPIIMGQNIGTCVTAMLSSVGTNRNARRAALVHLSFNIIGTASLLLPATALLEKLPCRLIPDPLNEEKLETLDERLMTTPSLAVQRCRNVTEIMAGIAANALRDALAELTDHDEERAARIMTGEANADHYEDILGTYLVKLSAMPLSEQDTVESSELLHMIGDLERISDHAVNLLEAGQELREKNIVFTAAAQAELKQLTSAVDEVVELAMRAFSANDLTAAAQVEPLEQVVDDLKEKLRLRHIGRLQRGECSIEAGFIWSDLLTDLERVADHCSNIAGCVLEMRHERLDLHGYLDTVRTGSAEYTAAYGNYARKYAVD